MLISAFTRCSPELQPFHYLLVKTLVEIHTHRTPQPDAVQVVVRERVLSQPRHLVGAALPQYLVGVVTSPSVY